ncbi:MAG: putative capsular polysaccharide synthesis family protein [Actinomycetota bacterium]|nr:putative capsular polysaccharide synthesis family protein [Actinomycetota bacterium]
MAQAVSAYFHAARRSGALADAPTVKVLTDRFVSEHWLRAPQRWFDREFGTAVGVDAFALPFDPSVGHGIIETPAVRLLLLRLESFGCAPSVLASFLGLAEPVVVPRRNDGASGQFAPIYREFLGAAQLPGWLLDEAYGSQYARHFYAQGEIAQFRRHWSKD